MSKIIEKAFDAGKKIVRSIFLGSPNLLTSSDLNRQFEAMKYQLDQLDEKTGVGSDFSISASVASGTLSVSYDYSFINYKGCSFSPAKTALSINLTSSAPIAYICLTAEQETLTYDTDSTHEIAGAKFEDGTSYAAANQIVYKNEQVVATHSLTSVSNLVGVLAIIELSTSGNLVIKYNCIHKDTSLSMGSNGVIKDFDNSARGVVKNGITYDRAFSFIENRFTNLCSDWTRFIMEDGATVAEGVFRIVNGTLQISKFSEFLIIPEYGSRKTPSFHTLGKFPTDIESALVDYFNREGFVHHDRLVTGMKAPSFVPFADLGTCSVIRTMELPETGDTTTSLPRAYGFGSMNLILTYDDEDNLDGVVLGFILRHFIDYPTDSVATPSSYPDSGGVINLGYAENACVYIPRGIYSIPLMGGFK